LKELFDILKAEFELHRDETLKNLSNLNIKMPTKADKADLLDLEKRVKEIIDDIVRQMLELMPSKEDL